MSTVITIDGPTSSGKSSVGLLFSQKIGFKFIDTGAIYRAGSFKILKEGISPENEAKVAEVFNDMDIRFETHDVSQKIYLEGEDITSELHKPEITSIVPIVAANKKARDYAKALQRKIGSSSDTVMTGRDIGSEIFPDSKLKFFLTASPEVRADRRYQQIKKTNPEITFESVLENMLDRDKTDSTREASPFRKPADAVVVDTSNLTTEESVQKMLECYQEIYK